MKSTVYNEYEAVSSAARLLKQIFLIMQFVLKQQFPGKTACTRNRDENYGIPAI